jgi:CubicO group peptidase (beta-lactamase class C family)
MAASLAAPAHRAAAQRAGEWMRAYLAQSRVPGAAVAVVAGGQVVWSEGFGLADVEQRVPVTPRTRFRLGSVSKLFAAAAAVKLSETGRLDLDTPVQRYVPTFPVHAGPPITVRLLAGHLAGIRGYRASDFAPGRNVDLTVFPTTDSALAIFRGDSLVAPPGSAYRYSTFGYTLLDAALAGAAGEDYTAALHRLVLAPLGLTHTVPDRWDALVAERTRFYGYAGPDAAPVNEAPVFATYKWAGGGMLSTADDLARFGAAHLRPGFFSAAGLRALFTPQRTMSGELTGVGLGWRVGTDLAGRVVYHHAGTIEGGRAALLVYPTEGVVVALLTNRTAAVDSPELMAQLLAAPFLPRAATAARASGAATAPGAGVSGGVYRVRFPADSGAGRPDDVRLTDDGRGTVPTPPALRERARQAGLPMPATLPVLGGAPNVGGHGFLVVASPLGLHALRVADAAGRLSGDLVVALETPALRPAATRLEGERAAAGVRQPPDPASRRRISRAVARRGRGA